jgi:hypothetical protein
MTCRRLLPRSSANGLARRIFRFSFDRHGNVTAIFALLLVPLIGVLSLAAETSSWFLMGRAAQNAADSAALAAAANFDTSTCTTGCPDWLREAKAVAANSGFTDGADAGNVNVNAINTASCPSGGNNCYLVTIKKWVPLYLVGVMGYSGSGDPLHSGRQLIQVSALAGPGQGGTVCILALDTRSGDIHSIFGGTNATATIGGSCTVANNDPTGNGGDYDSSDVKSGATLNFAGLSLADNGPCDPGCAGTLIVNGTTITNGAQKPQGAKYDQPAVIDPYAGRTIPAATGSCDHTNLTVSTSTTLSQGTYCSNSGNAALTVSQTSTNLNTTTNPPPAGTKVLNFPSTSGVSNGLTVTDTSHTAAIPAGTVVSSFTATTVTLSATALGGPTGVHANDVINFLGPTPTVTMSSGVYILDGQGGGTGASACGTGTSKPTGCLSGDLIVNNGAVVTGTGVTIVMTTSKGVGIDVGNMYITNGSSLSITAPASNVGGYQVSGIGIWQDKIAPNPTVKDGNMYTSTTAGVNTVASGASTDITGLIYFPSQGLFYSGGSGGSVCTQIVAFSIVFVNRSTFSYPSGCPSAAGEQSIGTNVGFASLVQ